MCAFVLRVSLSTVELKSPRPHHLRNLARCYLRRQFLASLSDLRDSRSKHKASPGFLIRSAKPSTNAGVDVMGYISYRKVQVTDLQLSSVFRQANAI